MIASDHPMLDLKGLTDCQYVDAEWDILRKVVNSMSAKYYYIGQKK